MTTSINHILTQLLLIVTFFSARGQEDDFFGEEEYYESEKVNYVVRVKTIEDTLKSLPKEKLAKGLVLYGDIFSPVKVVYKHDGLVDEYYFEDDGFAEERVFFMQSKLGKEVNKYCLMNGSLALWINSKGDSLDEKNKTFRLRALWVEFRTKSMVYKLENEDKRNNLTKTENKEIKNIDRIIADLEVRGLKYEPYYQGADEHDFFVNEYEVHDDVYVDIDGVKRKTEIEETYRADCGFGDTRSRNIIYFDKKGKWMKTIDLYSDLWMIDPDLGDERYQGNVMEEVTYYLQDKTITFQKPLVTFP